MAEAEVKNNCRNCRAVFSANLPKRPQECLKPLIKGTFLDLVAQKLAAKDADVEERSLVGSIRATIEYIMNNIGWRPKKRTADIRDRKDEVEIEPLVSVGSHASRRTFFHHKRSRCRIHHLHHRKFHSVTGDPFEKSHFDKIDTNALCAKCFDHQEKACNFGEAQEAVYRSNLCSAKCRPAGTLLNFKERIKRPYPKATYTHTIRLDDETLAGRAFPMKIRLRRDKSNCVDCGRDLLFSEPVTVNTSVVVISNCCDITVYDKKYLDNWHRVPIISVTGKGTLKKKTLNEVCKLEPKREPPPPPEVVEPPPPPPPKQKKVQKKKK